MGPLYTLQRHARRYLIQQTTRRRDRSCASRARRSTRRAGLVSSPAGGCGWKRSLSSRPWVRRCGQSSVACEAPGAFLAKRATRSPAAHTPSRGFSCPLWQRLRSRHACAAHPGWLINSLRTSSCISYTGCSIHCVSLFCFVVLLFRCTHPRVGSCSIYRVILAGTYNGFMRARVRAFIYVL